MNLLQMEYDLLPVRVLKEDKADYIQALADTRENEDIRIFLDCMTRLHIEHLRSDIEQFLKSTEDGNSDGRKETTQNNVAEKLTERQSIILSLIGRRVADDVAQNVAVNTKYLSEKLNVNRKTIQRDVKHLLEKKLIQWVGSDKSGHWEITKEG